MNNFIETLREAQTRTVPTSPDFSDIEPAVFEVLKAYGRNIHATEKIVNLYLSDESVCFDTEYGSGGYNERDSHYIPLSIFEAENPLVEARIRFSIEGIEGHEKAIERLKKDIEYREKRIKELNEEVLQLKKSL